MRRNRTAVTAASAAVLVAVVGLAAVLAVQSRANLALTAKNAELDMANRREAAANAELRESNDRVQARFYLAREAIRSFQQGVTEDDMLKGEELKGLRNKLLRSAAGFYEKLETLLQGQADRPSRAILAQSYFELGELTDKIGIKPEALAVHHKALAIRRELAVGLDADVGPRLDLARSLIAAGLLSEATGDSVGALSAFEEAPRSGRSAGQRPGRHRRGPGCPRHQPSSDRQPAEEHRQVDRGVGVVPSGVGDPSAAVRGPPRRHRIPHEPG